MSSPQLLAGLRNKFWACKMPKALSTLGWVNGEFLVLCTPGDLKFYLQGVEWPLHSCGFLSSLPESDSWGFFKFSNPSPEPPWHFVPAVGTSWAGSRWDGMDTQIYQALTSVSHSEPSWNNPSAGGSSEQAAISLKTLLGCQHKPNLILRHQAAPVAHFQLIYCSEKRQSGGIIRKLRRSSRDVFAERVCYRKLCSHQLINANLFRNRVWPWLSASPEDPVVSFLHHTRWSLFAKVVSAYAWAGKHLQLFQKSLQ